MEARSERRPARQIADPSISASESARAQPMVKRFDFHLCHVDARRTFAPAALAAHAQIERVANRGRSERVRTEVAGPRKSQRIRPASCQMLLVPRRAKARAHRSGVELAAMPVVVAH